jgi:phospho-N-acetylmuramoyl-pentapeptide-transferase
MLYSFFYWLSQNYNIPRGRLLSYISVRVDGLAAGVSAFVVAGIAILAYVSGNTVFADYLNIMYIPNISEIVIFSAALIGACIGFYWWNCYPAKIFMGDTGSLMLGGIINLLLDNNLSKTL